MDTIDIMLVLVIVGILLHLVNTTLPLVGWMKTIINALSMLLVIVWLINLYGAHVRASSTTGVFVKTK